MGAAAAAIGIGAIAGGTALSAWGSLAEGEAARAAARYNARLATQEAGEEADRIRTLGRRRASVNVTRVAKSGVRMEGSPLMVMAENAYEVEKQAQAVIRSGAAASRLYRLQGQSAHQAGVINAFSSGLTGIGSLFGAGTSAGAFGAGGAAPGSGGGVPAGVGARRG